MRRLTQLLTVVAISGVAGPALAQLAIAPVEVIGAEEPELVRAVEQSVLAKARELGYERVFPAQVRARLPATTAPESRTLEQWSAAAAELEVEAIVATRIFVRGPLALLAVGVAFAPDAPARTTTREVRLSSTPRIAPAMLAELLPSRVTPESELRAVERALGRELQRDHTHFTRHFGHTDLTYSRYRLQLEQRRLRRGWLLATLVPTLALAGAAGAAIGIWANFDELAPAIVSATIGGAGAVVALVFGVAQIGSARRNIARLRPLLGDGARRRRVRLAWSPTIGADGQLGAVLAFSF